MIRKLFFIIAILSSSFFAKGQVPFLQSNTTEDEKSTSIIYKNFGSKYDFIIAYTRDSYWLGNIKSYSMLAVKNGIWSKGYIVSKKSKRERWSKPKIKFIGVNSDSSLAIVEYLTNAGFYALNKDSLGIDKKDVGNNKIELFSINDGVDYKFEVLSKNAFVIIESYEPDYFLEKMPYLKDRRCFIMCRNWFTNKYKKL